MDREYPQDEKTVLLDRQGRGPAQGPMTDFASPPRFEQLEDRMIYAARLQGAEHFDIGLNSLVAPAWELLSEVVRLKRSSAEESLRALNERLSAAVTLFETRARHDGAQG
ncbi:MAG: DotU family type IV/VI secretion system protein, partial [Pseudomonadota bacterium]|nr:DotU family type IV/VI secretion system protein [Pseudomonadota bacterium]